MTTHQTQPSSKTPYDYFFFGAHLRSEIPLPSLPLSRLPLHTAPGSNPAITLTLGETPTTLPNPILSNPFLQIAPGLAAGTNDHSALINIPAVARFHLPNASEIILQPVTTHPEEIETLLLSTVAAIHLHQRPILPLRAAAVLLDGRAIAFSGHPTNGKSTLAAAFLQRHPTATLLADNLCALEISSGKPAIHPAVHQLRLWPDVMDHLNIPADHRHPLRTGETRRAVAFPAAGPAPAHPITHLFRLGARLNHGQPELTRVRGAQAVFSDTPSLIANQLIGHLFRNQLLELRSLSALGRHTRVFNFRRNRNLTDLNQCLDLIDEALIDAAIAGQSIPEGKQSL